MSKSLLSKAFIPLIAVLALALAPNPAFAQRGGGHGGGGGFHGGGAFRGGGFGGGYRGGNFGGARSFGGGAYRGGLFMGGRSFGSRGVAGFGRGFNAAGRGYSARNGYGARNAIADGNW